MKHPEQPQDQIEYVADAVKIDREILRLANYPETKLHEIYNAASKSEKISKYVSAPAGLVTIGLFIANAFANSPARHSFAIPFIAAVLIFMGSSLLDKRSRLRQQIKTDALERGLELNKQNAPKP